MNERKESLDKIKKAYENGELGFQRRAGCCRYYCKDTDSHCAVGVLVGKNEELFDDNGNITIPFKDTTLIGILRAMKDLKLDSMWGLTIDELDMLQSLHDDIVRGYDSNERFKKYLYSLV